MNSAGRKHSRLFFCISLFFTLWLANPGFCADGEQNKSLFPTVQLLFSNPHQGIREWQGTATCLQCHPNQGVEMFQSVHYQWLGDAPKMLNQPQIKQGKLDVGVNSYCINILGNWDSCGNCHAGLGLRPEEMQSGSQLENIDCLICHQEKYIRKKENGVFVPDLESMDIDMLQAARTVHRPTRTTCLVCHAVAGGGDNYKRGDLTLAHGNTSDRNFDVHMASSGQAKLRCQNCHITEQHRIAGRGSDLRPTDLDVAMECTTCHPAQLTSQGHLNPGVFRHQQRVACQTCHIPRYARDAADTVAEEKTEMHRDWTNAQPEPGMRFEPEISLEGNIIPEYRFWDGFSTNYLLFDEIVVDPETNRIPTSRPSGNINSENSKLYPFKYKTALQPRTNFMGPNQLIALDTSVYFATGDHLAATEQGLVNMGLNATDPYVFDETDTFQLITHEVAPAGQSLDCLDCHGDTTQMDLQGELGFQPKGPTENVVGSICAQCHEWRSLVNFDFLHSIHVRSERRDCSWCHNFSRPEQGLTTP